ncbi:hypothetical protein scyTo_0005833, partial [Scyliorhinus torazame]|nr:hypothetical protein [Scyliorhinus torazame]
MWRKIPLMVAVFVAACTSDNPEQCNNPPTVTSADVKNEYGIQQEFTVGRHIHYECLLGYTWNNSTPNFVVCQANLTWSEPLISCIPKDCGEPKDMQNGYYTTTGKTYGKVATYHCNKGYHQFGKSDALCTVAGWDKIMLFCQ